MLELLVGAIRAGVGPVIDHCDKALQAEALLSGAAADFAQPAIPLCELRLVAVEACVLSEQIKLRGAEMPIAIGVERGEYGRLQRLQPFLQSSACSA